MRYKVAPEPRSLAFLREVQRALPLTPGSVDDCCARVVAETDVTDRADAQDWITFLEALELVEDTGSGYRRVRVDPADASLGTAFRERVFGAREVLDALADGEQVDADEVFEAVRGVVPDWERDREPDWEAVWRERVARLLEWAVRFDLAERTDDGYRRR